MAISLPDPWPHLRRLTPARIALGRAGSSLPTHAVLDFQLAHARARDAVHAPFDAEQLAYDLASLGVPVIVADTAAPDRPTYLRRPDLGRQLSDAARQRLERAGRQNHAFDLSITISDGLSALAAQRHAAPLLRALLPRLADQWRLTPLVVARFGRVALQDQVGALLHASIALMLIGERPGLSAPDSLAGYFVHDPRPGRTDADRNCVSNIRPQGLPPSAAAETLHYLLTQCRQRRLSGVALKDDRTPRLT